MLLVFESSYIRKIRNARTQKSRVIRFNDGVDYSDFEISSFLGNKSEEIIEHLDDQAKGAIRAMVMMEYARCNSITNDAVIKSLGVITK